MKHILVAIDGSERTAAIIEKAIEMAKSFSSKVTLLNVYEVPIFVYNFEFGYNPWLDELKANLSKKSGEILESARKNFTEASIEADTVSLEGSPASQIIDYVCEHEDIDLIIMGSYGMSGFRRFFLGSITNKVAAATEKPILIV